MSNLNWVEEWIETLCIEKPAKIQCVDMFKWQTYQNVYTE